MGCNTSSEAKPTKEDSKNGKTDKDSENKPSAEVAATKIQAAFRGHQTRKSINMKSSASGTTKQQEPTRAELEAEFRADDKELCNAASKIQASFRGNQARKQTDQEKEAKDKDKDDTADIEDIDLNDPELNKAATKIQASFRGHKVRKEVEN